MKGKLNLLQRLGFLLVFLSCVLLLGSELLARHNRTQALALGQQLKDCLPERTEGDTANYSDPAMPVLELEGEDFSCLLEVPAFGVCLPVAASWDPGSISRYPCHFYGSVYDRSFIIGGSGQSGQLDFCGKLDLGQKIRVTDMAGAQFSYEVVRIDHRKHADLDTLLDPDSHLTLFARDRISTDYLIVRCVLAP